jgi:hypothetical protein
LLELKEKSNLEFAHKHEVADETETARPNKASIVNLNFSNRRVDGGPPVSADLPHIRR